jgi:uncharacterized membrane protein
VKYSTFKMIKLVIVTIIAISVSAAVAAGYAYVPVPVAAIGAAVLLLIRRAVKEVVVDERTWRIADHAGRLAFQAGAMSMALMAAMFLSLAHDSQEQLSQAGFTLAYTAAGLLVIYYCGYMYYARKFGGED